MTLKFHWFLPTYGDSRYIVGGGHGMPAGTAGGLRPATLANLGRSASHSSELSWKRSAASCPCWSRATRL